MRRAQQLQRLGMAAVILFAGLVAGHVPVRAEVSAPSLIVSQLKVTSSNGQFITLYNTTATALDLSKYQLQYFNHYDLSKATSSRLIGLSGIVPSHGYVIVNDSTITLCYQLVVHAASLGFSTTAGMVQVLGLSQTNAGGSVAPTLQDYVSWSKTPASGVQTLPTSTSAFMIRQPRDAQNHPDISSSGGGSWQTVQPDAADACSLVTVSPASTSVGAVDTGFGLLLPGIEPWAIIGDAETVSSLNSTSFINAGLMKPMLTEILPNPAGTGTDGVDEFIELYNSNDVPFDLSGYRLQVGTTALRSYTFPAGTSLPPLSFAAYYSLTTGLSLSNTTSQAQLLDPSGLAIATTEVYKSAADGQAWALAKGMWQWTIKPTPGATNVISKPLAKKTTGKRPSIKSKTKASNTKPKNARPSTTGTQASSFTKDDTSTPIHTGVLALVGGGALLYGVYEYRADLGNRIYQLRRHFSTRRANRL